MERIPEPELMNDEDQVVAYASADFSVPHGQFIEHLLRIFPQVQELKRALDLGCGPGDISVRIARVCPGLAVVGVDGASRMLDFARKRVEDEGLAARVQFAFAHLPDRGEIPPTFDLLISNSLLHHLADPMTLWSVLKQLQRPGACWLVGDLLRPPSVSAARDLVAAYADSEPPILQHDFFNSLLASYSPEEVAAQLERAGLSDCKLEIVSDRHWIAYGYF